MQSFPRLGGGVENKNKKMIQCLAHYLCKHLHLIVSSLRVRHFKVKNKLLQQVMPNKTPLNLNSFVLQVTATDNYFPLEGWAGKD